MPKRIWVYLQASKPGRVRSKSMGMVRYIDELRANPGGHVEVVTGAFQIEERQIVRFPSAFYLRDNIHRLPWLTRVEGLDMPEPESEPADEAEPEPEPAKRRPGRPRKVRPDAD